MYRLPMSILLLLMMASCEKKSSSVIDPVPHSPKTVTSGLGTVRNWHGHYYYASGTSYTSRALPDTSFAVSVINDTTVSCMGTSFKYVSSDSARQVHYFGFAKAYYEYGPGRGEGIAYFYDADSIVFLKEQDAHSTTTSYVLDVHYYTY